MNEERRRTLSSICSRLDLLVDELNQVLDAERTALESRTVSSQHSEGGYVSDESIASIEDAASTISNATEELRNFVTSESRPSTGR
jgi:hypothetical protein